MGGPFCSKTGDLHPSPHADDLNAVCKHCSEPLIQTLDSEDEDVLPVPAMTPTPPPTKSAKAVGKSQKQSVSSQLTRSKLKGMVNLIEAQAEATRARNQPHPSEILDDTRQNTGLFTIELYCATLHVKKKGNSGIRTSRYSDIGNIRRFLPFSMSLVQEFRNIQALLDHIFHQIDRKKEFDATQFRIIGRINLGAQQNVWELPTLAPEEPITMAQLRRVITNKAKIGDSEATTVLVLHEDIVMVPVDEGLIDDEASLGASKASTPALTRPSAKRPAPPKRKSQQPAAKKVKQEHSEVKKEKIKLEPWEDTDSSSLFGDNTQTENEVKKEERDRLFVGDDEVVEEMSTHAEIVVKQESKWAHLGPGIGTRGRKSE